MGLNVESYFCQNIDKDKRWQQYKNVEHFTFPAPLLNRYVALWDPDSWNLDKNHIIVLWIGVQPYIEMSPRQFSIIPTYVKVVGKIPDQHFDAILISNPKGKVLILVGCRRQIYPIVFRLFMTLSPGLEINDKLKCWSYIFPTTCIYSVILENFIKPGSQRATYGF